jgi:hypothetical protein
MPVSTPTTQVAMNHSAKKPIEPGARATPLAAR